jgi:predicted acylesterase/phospholipase RssA
MAEIRESLAREREYLDAIGHTGPMPTATFLALSGGGANGAFGSGLLCGWSDSGLRPEFKVVTGISTGALIAPFAFLGPDHDATIEHFYTTISTEDILRPRGILAGLTHNALADSEPLQELLAEVVDHAIMEAIAAEHEKGRILLIGTADLDAERAVIWNLGVIAASDHPEALRLMRDVLLASASIPAAFPPVMFDVHAGGDTYQEMHVDGGARTQVFLYPPSFRLEDAAGGRLPPRDRVLYVIRNSRIIPIRQQVEPRTLAIAARAIDSLISSQGIGDLYRIYTETQRDQIEFNLAYIPEAFERVSDEPFDPKYMQALFDLGYQMASEGYPWEKKPPGLASQDD